MRRKETGRSRQQLAVLALFATLLLNFPMLSVLPSAADFPAAGWLYLFAVWAGVIALAALNEHGDRP